MVPHQEDEELEELVLHPMKAPNTPGAAHTAPGAQRTKPQRGEKGEGSPRARGGEGEASLQVYFGLCFIPGLLTSGISLVLPWKRQLGAQHGVQPSPRSNPGPFLGKNHPKPSRWCWVARGTTQTGFLSRQGGDTEVAALRAGDVLCGEELMCRTRENPAEKGGFARVNLAANISSSREKGRKFTWL